MTDLFVYLPSCLVEANERVDALKHPDEPVNRDHESHELFKEEQDVQLVMWTQRYVRVP